MGRRGCGDQVEGAWNVDGKGISVQDMFTNGSHGIPRRR